jgi:hypothetical protein
MAAFLKLHCRNCGGRIIFLESAKSARWRFNVFACPALNLALAVAKAWHFKTHGSCFYGLGFLERRRDEVSLIEAQA